MPTPAACTTTRDRRLGRDRRSHDAELELHASDHRSATAGTCTGLVYDDSKVVRTSVGVGLIWASPFGPLRFDYAVPLTKGK